jgi:hypothetical protein
VPKLVLTKNYGTRSISSGVGRVLHYSPRAVNLEFGRRVVTLINRNGLSAPSTIVTYLKEIPRISTGYFDNGRLITDLFSVKLSNPVDLKLDFELNDISQDYLHLIRIHLHNRKYSIANALLRLEGEKVKVSGVDKAVTDKEYEILHHTKDIRYLIENLLGLGFGLTPSGDDFIIGIIAAHNVLGMETTEIHNTIESYSYSYSRTMMEDALSKRYPEILHSFLNSLNKGNLDEHNIIDLQKVGHSSGTDILAGLYYSFKYLLSSS